jgi:ABC-type bacteriocin/lantibiotic exporter with double-glycine peptidase domain
MDCGPASLKALLEGFGVPVSYGRLREACFTGVDGTSIDQIEDAAVGLGLDAEQIMLPVDHVLLDDAAALPALVVVRLPGGATHFVVVWRRFGNWIQLMDPGHGRQWRSCREFLSELYVHSQEVSAADWCDWARSPAFLKPLATRLRKLGIDDSRSQRLIAAAVNEPGPNSLAAIDAATRLVESLAEEAAVSRGPATADLVSSLANRPDAIPQSWWSARLDPDRSEHITTRGAVLMRVRGVRQTDEVQCATISTEFGDALTERSRPPLMVLWQTLRADGIRFHVALAAGLGLSAGGVVAEAVLFRGLFDLGHSLGLGMQRWCAIAALAIFFAAVTLLELSVNRAVLRTGWKFEGLLRLEFLRKIPRLCDSYFRSRLMSDMADRAHSAHRLRDLPTLASALARAVFTLMFTVGGIAWLYPESVVPALTAAAIAVAVPLFAQPWLAERDLRARTHAGALSRFFLDTLLGLTAIRAHGAGRAIAREHDNLLTEWARASLQSSRSTIAVQSLQATLCAALVTWLLYARLAEGRSAGGLLLLVYWAVNIPALGQEIAALACQYPRLRNTLLRFTEPLGAREEEIVHDVDTELRENCGVGISVHGVKIAAGGHTVLDDVDLSIKPGEHVAIVGASGAGKSTLAGLLLGWHKPSTGELRVDGQVLNSRELSKLRRSTVWISPQVHLWNRSLFENLAYGGSQDASVMDTVLEDAELVPVIEKLPKGMQSALGESGRLLSGGEGQRVRFGRALQRTGVRLAILDEAFRGLERARRRMLLDNARRRWKSATFLNITHDVGETLSFERVLVMEGGRIIEDGAPNELYARPASRYRSLLEAEESARERVWADPNWRRITVQDGRVHEQTRDLQQETVC